MKLISAQVPFIAFLLLLAAFGLIGLSAINDLRFMIYSTTVDAKLISSGPKDAAASSTDKRTAVQYSFNDPSIGERVEDDLLPAHWSAPNGATVPVAYIAGVKDASHVVGNWDGYWLFMSGFLGVLALLIGIPIYQKNRSEPAAPNASSGTRKPSTNSLTLENFGVLRQSRSFRITNPPASDRHWGSLAARHFAWLTL